MENKETYSKGTSRSFGFSMVALLIFSIIGFFNFGIEGALGVALLFFLYQAVTTFVSLIPIVGVPIVWALMTFLIKPFVLDLTPLVNSPMTLGVYWFNLGMAIIINILASIFLAIVIADS